MAHTHGLMGSLSWHTRMVSWAPCQARLTSISLPTTPVVNKFVSNFGSMSNVVVTHLNMTQKASLVVCFATGQSQLAGAAGNSADDYVALKVPFRHRAATEFNPKVVIVENEHYITLSGGEAEDTVYWTQGDNCSHTKVWIALTPIPTIATATVTQNYVLTSEFGTEILHVPRNMSIGAYRVCYKPKGGVTTLVVYMASWLLADQDPPVVLTVLPRPSPDILTFDITKVGCTPVVTPCSAQSKHTALTILARGMEHPEHNLQAPKMIIVTPCRPQR